MKKPFSIRHPEEELVRSTEWVIASLARIVDQSTDLEGLELQMSSDGMS